MKLNTSIRQSRIWKIFFIGGLYKNIFSYIIIIFMIINIVLVGLSVGMWIYAAHHNLFGGVDFINFYTGFKMVLNGDGANLYNLDLQAKYQQAIMKDGLFQGGLLPYNTPPFVAVLFSPLALLPVNMAYYIWTLGELGLLAWVLILINRLCAHWSRKERLVMNVSFLGFWPLILTFSLGQFSLLFLLSMLQLYISLKDNQIARCGFWLSALLIKPHMLPIPGAITLNKKYWKAALATALSGLCLFLVSSIVAGFDTWIQYFRVVPEMINNFGKYGFVPEFQYTLRGMLTNFLGYSQTNIINLVTIITFVLSLIVCWWLWWRTASRDSLKLKLYFAFTIVLLLFINLHAYAHDDLLLVLPAILMYDYLRENEYPKKTYAILILTGPLIFFITAITNFTLLGIFRLPVIVILLLLIWIAYYLYRDTHQLSPQTTTSS